MDALVTFRYETKKFDMVGSWIRSQLPVDVQIIEFLGIFRTTVKSTLSMGSSVVFSFLVQRKIQQSTLLQIIFNLRSTVVRQSATMDAGFHETIDNFEMTSTPSDSWIRTCLNPTASRGRNHQNCP